jgi:hypothetical protein
MIVPQTAKYRRAEGKRCDPFEDAQSPQPPLLDAVVVDSVCRIGRFVVLLQKLMCGRVERVFQPFGIQVYMKVWSVVFGVPSCIGAVIRNAVLYETPM